MQNEEVLKTKVNIWIMVKRFWPYMKKHPGLLYTAIFSMVGLAVVARLGPFLIGYAIDNGIKNGDKKLLFQIAIAYLIVKLLRAVFMFMQTFYFQKFGNRVLYYLREDLFKHTQSLPLQYFNKTPNGRIVTRLTNDVLNIINLFTDSVITVLAQSAMMIGILIALFSISVKLTLLTLILTPIFVLMAFKLSNKVQETLREQKKKLAEINSFLSENLNGIKVIQLYNRINLNFFKFLRYSAVYSKLNITTIQKYALMHPVLNIMNASAITSAVIFGALLSQPQQNVLAIGSLVAFILHTQDFIHPLRQILEKYQQFQNDLTSAERVFSLLDEESEFNKRELELIHNQSTQYIELKGDIQFKNLDFSYDTKLANVLSNIDLHIKIGESIALVGRTGSGKTTLISLLQRLYKPKTDSLFIDSIDINEISLKTLRSNIGIIQQDNFIFRGSIKSNISLGNSNISDDRIEFAANKVGLVKLLSKSNRNLDTIVEERGSNISAGERQLIAFARILAFDPVILILDEATSNIDSESEQIIQAATREITHNRTSIIIAHRLSTVMNCDRIIVLSDGKIIESGNHTDLLNKKGAYYQLANTIYQAEYN